MFDQWMEAFSKWNASTQMMFSCILLVAGFVLAILGCVFIHSLLRLVSDGVTALFWGWPVAETPPAAEEEDEEEEDDNGLSELLAEAKQTNVLLAEHTKVFKEWLDSDDNLIPLVEESNRMLALIVNPPKLFTGTQEDLDVLRKNWEALNAQYKTMKKDWDARNKEAVLNAEPLIDYAAECKAMNEERKAQENAKSTKPLDYERAWLADKPQAQEKVSVESDIELELGMDLKDK